MSQSLIDHNDDLRRLREDGFNVSVEAAHLIVRDIAYVGPDQKALRDGILITNLDLDGDVTRAPSDHQIWFSGLSPYKGTGQPYDSIRPNPGTLKIRDGLIGQFQFSAKPTEGQYRNYHHKVVTYAALLEKEAILLDPDATSRSRRTYVPDDDDTPFKYLDTASARAGINSITQKLAVDKIAIIGLGGTGSYVLDLVSKTPVKEIHLFDGDVFSSHNAFRAPGAPSLEHLRSHPSKVRHFEQIYENMRKGIIVHEEYIDNSNVELLRGMSTVFLCIDGGETKKLIVEKLEEFGVNFFDTGIGINDNDEMLGGHVQLTASNPNNREQAKKRISFVEAEGENLYARNIQIADLNALNAILAVIKWKKAQGFYREQGMEHFSIFNVGTNRLHNEDHNEQN